MIEYVFYIGIAVAPNIIHTLFTFKSNAFVKEIKYMKRKASLFITSLTLAGSLLSVTPVGAAELSDTDNSTVIEKDAKDIKDEFDAAEQVEVKVTDAKGVIVPCLTMPGKFLLEWNTKEDGSGESYQIGSVYEIGKDSALYAIWKDNIFTYVVDDELMVACGEEELDATITLNSIKELTSVDPAELGVEVEFTYAGEGITVKTEVDSVSGIEVDNRYRTMRWLCGR